MLCLNIDTRWMQFFLKNASDIQIQIQIQKKFIATQENTNHNLPMQI